MLHNKFKELLKYFSFTQPLIDKLILRVQQLAMGMLDIKDQRFRILKTQLSALEVKIENAEQKLFDDTINAATYKSG